MAICSLLAVGSGIGAYFVYLDLATYPEKPAVLTVAEAAALPEQTPPWVSLTDVRWRCDQTWLESDSRLDTVLASTTDEQIWIAASFSTGPKKCRQLLGSKPTGELNPLSPKRKEYLQQYGVLVGLPEGAKVYSLCTYCGRDNTQLGFYMLVGGVFALLALGLIVVWMNYVLTEEIAGRRTYNPTNEVRLTAGCLAALFFGLSLAISDFLVFGIPFLWVGIALGSIVMFAVVFPGRFESHVSNQREFFKQLLEQ